ncbi:MAG: phosphatidate cytidylyltransferase [Bacillota bacterium]
MLKERVTSAVLGLILLILIIYAGTTPFLIFLAILAVLAGREFVDFFKNKLKFDRYIIPFFSFFSLIFFYRAFNYNKIEDLLFFMLITITFTFAINIKTSGFDNILSNVGNRLFCLIYIGGGLSFLVLLKEINNSLFENNQALWLVLLVAWATDIGAYFIGIKFGKRPLAPVISPNKSIIGAIGGVSFAIIIIFIYSIYLDNFNLWIFPITIILSLSAIFGDLIESALKRDAKIKDSGEILPGHGGILDRFDSLLLVAPVAFLLIYYLI